MGTRGAHGTLGEFLSQTLFSRKHTKVLISFSHINVVINHITLMVVITAITSAIMDNSYLVVTNSF